MTHRSKRKAHTQCQKKTSPRTTYKLSRQERYGQKTELMGPNYTNLQIGMQPDTIEARILQIGMQTDTIEATILNKGPKKAMFTTAYTQSQLPVLPRQKTWSNKRAIERQPHYRGQWRNRKQQTKSNSQFNNMPTLIKGRKIIAAKDTSQTNTNQTMDLHIHGNETWTTGNETPMKGRKISQTRDPIHLPRIETFSSSPVKTVRPTAATSKLPLVSKHVQMYTQQ